MKYTLVTQTSHRLMFILTKYYVFLIFYKKTNIYIEALKIKTDQKYKKMILRQNENQSIDTKNWNQEDTNPFILIHVKKFLPLNKEITRRTV